MLVIILKNNINDIYVYEVSSKSNKNLPIAHTIVFFEVILFMCVGSKTCQFTSCSNAYIVIFLKLGPLGHYEK